MTHETKYAALSVRWEHSAPLTSVTRSFGRVPLRSEEACSHECEGRFFLHGGVGTLCMNTQMRQGAPQGAPLDGAKSKGAARSPLLEVQWHQESVSASYLPLVEGLDLSLRQVGAAQWNGASPGQVESLKRLMRNVGSAGISPLPHLLQTRASVRSRELSTFARIHKLNPVTMSERNNRVGFVSRMEVRPMWNARGVCTTIRDCFAGFRLSEEAGPRFYQRAQGALPLIVVPTMDGDLVLIDPSSLRLRGGSSPEGQLNVRGRELVRELAVARENGWLWSGATDLEIPMVNHSSRCNHDYWLGLFCQGRGARIHTLALAHAETTLILSEDGRLTKADSRNQTRRTFVVDRPFLLTVIRPGLAEPLFTGWYNESSWVRWG